MIKNTPYILCIKIYRPYLYNHQVSEEKEHNIYDLDLAIGHITLEKIEKILFLRNIRYLLSDSGRMNLTSYIGIHLTSDYSKELLNKDLGGSVKGYVLND